MPQSRDCNPCARDVEAQFSRKLHAPTFMRRTWRYAAGAYPPAQKSARYYLKSRGWSHVQGGVLSYSRAHAFIGSIGGKPRARGSLYVVGTNAGGQDPGVHELKSIYAVRNHHPSALALLGQFVLFADGANSLAFLDLNAVPRPDALSHVTIGAVGRAGGLGTAGGGIAAARLRSGGYLLLTTDFGRKRYRETRFFLLAGVLGAAEIQFQPLGSWTAPRGHGPARADALSLVTECGTGDIYAIHGGGDSRTEGHWMLSRVTRGDGGPALIELQMIPATASDEGCSMYSSATVHVSADHDLTFVCPARQPMKSASWVEIH